MKKQDILEAASSLSGLGLTDYQAQALAALFALKRATATELIPLTEIPKARVYGVLEELVTFGAVRKKPSRPRVYVVLEPEKAVSAVISFWEKKEAQKISRMKDLKKQITKKIHYSGEPTREKGEFLQILAASPASENETLQLYRQARKRIRILTGVFEYFPAIKSELAKARARGVKVEVIFSSSPRKESVALQKKSVVGLKEIGAQVRFATEMPLRGTIIDSDKSLFSVDVKRMAPSRKDMALTENANLVHVLNTFFDVLWKESR
ncbi:MAG: hypothetical protein KAW41_03025 [Candidatus Diapherotrites archaeon]|nr:hypothetical protein [Candidatus Diapherotrites archaeon]